MLEAGTEIDSKSTATTSGATDNATTVAKAQPDTTNGAAESATTNGDSTKPATDGQTVTENAADGRVRLLNEYLGPLPQDRAQPGDAPANAAGSKPTPETIEHSLSQLSKHLADRGADVHPFGVLKEKFQAAKASGKLPEDLRPFKETLDRLNKSGDAGTLTTETAQVMSRMLTLHLDGKVTFITPENVEQTVNRKVFNRENPDYQEGATNCRACSASYIMNEKLSERQMMVEYHKIVDAVESGTIPGSKINVPLEGGMPKMTAYLFQLNHGDAHSGIAGEKYTRGEMREFQAQYETVPEYIMRGLREAGFHNASLPGGEVKATRWPPTEPGFYILEHRTANTSSAVNGHVTVAYVEPGKKLVRIDSQIPENRSVEWPVTHAYKLVIGSEALESKNYSLGHLSLKVTNPDGTTRSLQHEGKTLAEMTDVDGKRYIADLDGKWRTHQGEFVSDAPFKTFEYLGAKEGYRFGFENYQVTEKPDGSASISIPDRPVTLNGKPLVVNGAQVKATDVITSITRGADGKFMVTFKDNTTTPLEGSSSSPQSSDFRSAQQLGEMLRAMDGTAGNGTLDKAILNRITTETNSGVAVDKAILRLVKPGVDNAGQERLAEISRALIDAGLPSDTGRIGKVDTVLSELKLELTDIKKANAVVDRAELHLKEGRELDGKKLTEKQALELAIIENMPDPSKGDGKPFSSRSTLKKLREFEEIRSEIRRGEPTLRECLAVQELLKKYPDSMTDTTMPKAKLTKPMQTTQDIVRAHVLVTSPHLADAERIYAQIGGKEKGFSLIDAHNIARTPEFRDNPALAAEIHVRAGTLRNTVSSTFGTGFSSGVSVSDYMRIAKRMVDNGKFVASDRDVREAIDEFRRENTAQVRARQEAEQARREAAELAETQRAQDGLKTTEAPSPIENSRLTTFKSRTANLDGMERPAAMAEYVDSARRALMPDVAGRRSRVAFAATKVEAVETTELKPGESQLAVSHQGNQLKVKGLEASPPPVFVTEDGTRVTASECKVEVRIGKGSSNQQAALETLLRVHELKEMIDGTRDTARRPVIDAAIRTAYDTGLAPTLEGPSQQVAERTAQIGEMKTPGRIEISLSESGVKFGDKGEMRYDQLVRETLKERRTQVEQMKRNNEHVRDVEVDRQIKLLNEQIADLDHLQRNMHRPETTAKLMEAIQKHATPQEIERLKAERTAGGGRFKAGIARAGAYTIVAAFVANMVATGTAGAQEAPEYAPTSG